MARFFELLLQTAVTHKVDLPILVSINGTGIIRGEVDSSQILIPGSPPNSTRLLSATLIDPQGPDNEPSFRVPRPPASAAVALPGGPNRRWLIMFGGLCLIGEDVEWDQWLDYNSTTNGGDWDKNVTADLKQLYPLHVDTRAYYHLINVQFLNTQIAAQLGGPVYVPTQAIQCCGNRW